MLYTVTEKQSSPRYLQTQHQEQHARIIKSTVLGISYAVIMMI